MVQRQPNIGPYILVGLIVHALIVSIAPAVYFSYIRDETRKAFQRAQQQPPAIKLYDEPLDRR